MVGEGKVVEILDAGRELGAGSALAAQPGLGLLPMPVLEKLHEFGRAAAKGGLAPKTISGMKSDGRLFVGWCAGRGELWLPAAPSTVAGFVEAMAASGKAPATVQRYLASIALWHKAAALPSPTSTVTVAMARRAHLRAVGKRQRQAKPVGERELAEIEAAMAETTALEEAGLTDEQGRGRGRPSNPEDRRLAMLRDRALLLVARDTLCRASELVGLRWDDLTLDEGSGEGGILVRRSKTDQLGEGRHKWLDIDTVQALLTWRQAHDRELANRKADEPRRFADVQARRKPGRAFQGRKRLNPLRPAVRLDWRSTSYLFRGLAPHYDIVDGVVRSAVGWSEQLSTAAVTTILKRRLTEAGIVAEGYSAHSTRVGGVQDLLADGADLLGVMDAGNWKSPAMPARYGEKIMASRGAVAARRRRKRAEAGEGAMAGPQDTENGAN